MARESMKTRALGDLQALHEAGLLPVLATIKAYGYIEDTAHLHEHMKVAEYVDMVLQWVALEVAA